MPLLLRVDPHDLVAEVLVLAADVRVGVVDVVVGVLPRLRGRGGVPVPGRGVDLGVVHPVPLAVHDVVADLHVLEDLGQPRGGGAERARPAGSARRSAATRAHHGEPPVHLDHRSDVVGVALAEVVEDLVVDRVELAAELLDLLVGQAGQRVLDRSSVVMWSPGSCVSVAQRSISTGPSGALTQMRTISPSSPWTSPRAQVAQPARSRACRRRCGRCPSGSRTAARRRPPRRRRGSACEPSRLGLDVALGKRDRAALALAAPSPPMIGWKRSMCSRSAIALAPPSARSSASSISAGPQRKVVALAPVGAELVEVGGRDPAVASRGVLDRAGGSPSLSRVELAQLGRRRSRRRRVGAEWRWTASSSASSRSRLAQHRHDRRDPAAGGDEQQLARAAGRAATNVPSTSPRRTIVPGLRAAGDVGRDLALLDELRGDRDEAVGAARVGGERVGAPVADAVDVEADPQVLAGLVAGPRRSRGGSATVTASPRLAARARSIRPRSSRVDHSGLISSR